MRIATLVALAAAGCGASAGAAKDAAAEAAVIDVMSEVAESDAPADECSLAAQDCPTGMKCEQQCTDTGIVISCIADPGGTQVHGDMCGGTMMCVKGHFCAFFTAPTGPSRQSCARYCDTADDCPDGLACTPFTQGCMGTFTRQLRRCEFAP